ncbi:MAG: TRAP transporter small permease subunit [Candidatus Accumulibacter sp.]|jgi:TRAP-type C4-dicarboxylate transport system permease small subunit|nr:TRAP transporter small permease subunit [Accumulibacter sp.]
MKKFIDYFEEYMCAFGLVVMTILTFVGVLSRKLPQVNLSWTMELVTTIFVWVCALAAAAAFKTNSHMGFCFLTDKLSGKMKQAHRILRIIAIFANYFIWIWFGSQMVMGQISKGLVTPVMATPGWLIGLAVPFSAVLSVIRILQEEFGYEFGKRVRGGEA